MPATRKLYNDLAHDLAIDVRNNPGAARAIAAVIRETIAPSLKRDNSSFNKARFFTACGLDSEGHVTSMATTS